VPDRLRRLGQPLRALQIVDTRRVALANLELVRSIYAIWGRGDFSSADWADPEIEFVLADGPSRGSWTGVARMAEAWRDFLSAWEEYRVEAEEYRELDGERVLVFAHISGRGRQADWSSRRCRRRAPTFSTSVAAR
jgi:hypothetical protein